jgi:hypothetical protein
MLSYVFDFGHLEQHVEEMYIGSMSRRQFPNVPPLIVKILSAVIHASQNFVRAAESESSAVSLRDVRRCLLLVGWFDGPGNPHVTLRFFGAFPCNYLVELFPSHCDVALPSIHVFWCVRHFQRFPVEHAFPQTTILRAVSLIVLLVLLVLLVSLLSFPLRRMLFHRRNMAEFGVQGSPKKLLMWLDHRQFAAEHDQEYPCAEMYGAYVARCLTPGTYITLLQDYEEYGVAPGEQGVTQTVDSGGVGGGGDDGDGGGDGHGTFTFRPGTASESVLRVPLHKIKILTESKVTGATPPSTVASLNHRSIALALAHVYFYRRKYRALSMLVAVAFDRLIFKHSVLSPYVCSVLSPYVCSVLSPYVCSVLLPARGGVHVVAVAVVHVVAVVVS